MSDMGRCGGANFAIEASYGDGTTPDKHMSIVTEGIQQTKELVENQRIIGRIHSSGMSKTGYSESGPTALEDHPEETGFYLFGALGGQTAPVYARAAKIAVYYRGTDAYASLTMASGTLTGKSGATQAGASTAFALDTSNASYDTVTELVAAINAVSDWAAFAFGIGGADTAGIADFAETQIYDKNSLLLYVRTNGIIVEYTGADAYASLQITTGSIIGKSGANQGAAVAAFTLDLTDAANDTLTELVAVIDAVADWSCTLVGLGTKASGFSNFAEVEITGAAYYVGLGAARDHALYPAACDTKLKSFCIQLDRELGTNKEIRIKGLKIDSYEMSVSEKALANVNLSWIGQDHVRDQNDITKTIIEKEPYAGPDVTVIMDGLEMALSKSLALTIANNLSANSALGRQTITEPLRQKLDVNVTLQEDLEDDVFMELDSVYDNNDSVELLIYMENTDYADTGETIPYSKLIRVRSIKLSQCDSFLSTPDRLTADFAGSLVHNGNFTNQVDVEVVDTRASIYS